MANNVIKKYPDLSNIEGSVTQVIEEATPRLAKIDDLTDEEFKQLAIEIVSQAKETNKQREILARLERHHDKNTIIQYLYNVYLAGTGNAIV